jgi:hypothetical protein
MAMRLIYKPTKLNRLSPIAGFLKMTGFLCRFPRLLSSLWRRWFGRATPGLYRPEQHYMRGPGPKSSTKGGGKNGARD